MRGQLPIGSVLAGYRVLGLVGEGAGGTVYLVERVATGERAALKVLAAELAHDERFRRRFLRESTLAAGLRHPHVVPILDFGETEGDLFLAMRHVDGSDLRERLARGGPLEPAEALRLVAQIGEALDDAHARGLVHRDVKPANILVDDDGEAFLTDFGLAKHASSVSSLTADHAFVGTIAYVAPEQIRGEEVDGRADVYSLGVAYTQQWSPISHRSGVALFVVSAKGGKPRRVTSYDLAAGDHPDWSPDGQWVVFRTHADVDNGPSQLSIIHPDGRGLRHLTPADGTVLSSSYSPDGKWIAYGAQSVDFTPDVFIMRADGSDNHTLTRTKLWDSAPDWGP